ncbi:MAG: response regulator [Candidatus Omnitrophica bacterium]|nr:response regulator [Candidatus Omnitrophota bacterium]
MFKLRNTKRFQILVIDDDTEFSEPLCKMLTRQGYAVFNAANGQEGLNLFKEHQADLVIADIVLPDRDGFHIILDLQKILPDVKIIAISGGGHCASGEEYLDDVQLLCNVQHTLAKPFNRDKLFRMIHEMLD